MDRLEKRVIELAPETKVLATAQELFTQGYEPHHRSFRKEIVDDLYICFKEVGNGRDFEFAAVVRYG